MKKVLTVLAASAAISIGTAMAALAGSHAAWTLDGADSKIAFGSVKKDSAGESHHFTGLSGMLSESGELAITIDLASVETWIDIRNERMRDHVFHNAPEATLSAALDMDRFADIPEGGTGTVPVNATLSLLGTDVVVQTDMFVIRLDDDTVIAVTDEMAWFSTEELGIDRGIDKLMELAGLPGITRAVPVTARLIFTR